MPKIAGFPCLVLLASVVLAVASSATSAPSPTAAFDLRADFSATGDGIADDGPALRRGFDAALASGRPLHIPAGRYATSSPLLWDMAPAATRGVTVTGDGPRATVILFRGDAPGTGLTVSCRGGCDSFYGVFRDFGVEGNVPGALWKVGEDDCSDSNNQFRIEDVAVQNGSLTAGSAALELNGFYNGSVAATLDCGGPTGECDALRLRSAQFSVISGSHGNAGTGTRLAGGRGRCGYVVGNTFLAVDHEVVGTGILVESARATRNTWVGGQMALYGTAFDFRAGRGNLVTNMNVGTGNPGSEILRGHRGLNLDLPGSDLLPTPSVPPSGTALENAGGQTEAVNLLGGSVSRVSVGGATLCQSSPCSVILNPGDEITLEYSAPPSWTWRSVR